MTVIIAFVLRSVIVAVIGLGAAQLLSKRGPAYASLAYKTTLFSLLAVAALSFMPVKPSSHALRIPAPAVAAASPQAVNTSTVASAGKAKHVNSISAQSAAPQDGGARCAIGLWLLGVTLLLLRVSAAQLSLFSLKRRSQVLKDSSAALALSSLSNKGGIPNLLTHPSVKSPFLAGIFGPSIYIPETLIGDEKLEPVLAHEMVHVEHNDCAWKLLQRFTSAVLWFNPLVWVLCKRFDESIEEHCDQVVIERGCARPVYARVLLELAQRGQTPSAAAALSAGVVDFRSTVGKRVTLILDASRKTAAVVSKGFRLASVPAAACLAIGVSVMITGEAIAQMSPQEIAKAKLQGMDNLKQIEMATLMYTNDYDDLSAYVDNTETFKVVLRPYFRTNAGTSGIADPNRLVSPGVVPWKEIWNTHNPKHTFFLFNLAIGGVSEAEIPEPANTVMWYESGPWPDGTRLVGYADGHVKRATAAEWESKKKYLTMKFKRAATRALRTEPMTGP